MKSETVIAQAAALYAEFEARRKWVAAVSSDMGPLGPEVAGHGRARELLKRLSGMEVAMKFEIMEKSVWDLFHLTKEGFFRVNSEYQRGAVWQLHHKKMLIDSILRGYPIPQFYFHKKSKVSSGPEQMRQDLLEVIDGQQRLDAIKDFMNDAYSLFDPKTTRRTTSFPKHIREQSCPWAGFKFSQLPSDLSAKFVRTNMTVVVITTDSEFEARDLFIRLQSGLPLNAQEKRDAWPGNFSEFVLRMVGKKGLYEGHPFFRDRVAGKGDSDRGKKRQLCAQMALLMFEKRNNRRWADIKSQSIDDYYQSNTDFNLGSPDAKRFEENIEIIGEMFEGQGAKELRGHEAIHVLLLTDVFRDDYTTQWCSAFPAAFEEFRKNVAIGKKERGSNEFWVEYDARTRTASDESSTIMARHFFFQRKIREYMRDLHPMDPRRTFAENEREYIYYTHDKKCAVCGEEIAWDDLEIHHQEPHCAGGRTVLENAKPVHRGCHSRVPR